MAYRNPRFYFHHAFRSAGAAALGGSTFDTAYPRERILDNAIGQNAKYAAAATDNYVKADRGGGSLQTLNRLIVPAGHTLAGTTLTVRSKATDPTNATDGTSSFNSTVAAGTQIIVLTPTIANRYILVDVGASGAWEFPELWMSVQRGTTRGPDPDWQDVATPNVSRQQLDSGATYRLQKGADRREYLFTYRALSGTDLLVFTDMVLETLNGTYPFYMDPPDDALGPMLVELLEPLEFHQDAAAPSTMGLTYQVQLHVRECLA